MKKVFILSVIGVLLFCSAASAISVTPFFKIVRDYEADSSKAYSKWLFERICIEGEIVSTGLSNQNFIVMVGKEYKGKKYNLDITHQRSNRKVSSQVRRRTEGGMIYEIYSFYF